MKITFFPVGNGDTTLINLGDAGQREDGRDTVILTDFYYSENGDQPIDVPSEVRERLPIDEANRPYVDAFCLSHPDLDHCSGLEAHFHLGPLADYEDEPEEGDKKIVIREMWSSPRVFRRKDAQGGSLCSDAKAWRKEAKRRVALFRESKEQMMDPPISGDRIRLIGKDLADDGTDKNADVPEIVVDIEGCFREIDGHTPGTVTMEVLGPLPKGEVEGDEESLSKNRSSVIISYHLQPDPNKYETLFLTGGDAEVEVWVRQWEKFRNTPARLEYDILLVPHHCSWHVLANQDCSWSDGCTEVNQDARSALSQARGGAYLISSSKPINDKTSDPPCTGARDEYKQIADGVGGEFFCTGEYPQGATEQEPIVIEISSDGPPDLLDEGAGGAALGAGLATRKNPRVTEPGGSDTFG